MSDITGARAEVLLNQNGFRFYSPNSLSSSTAIIQGYGFPTDDQEQNPPPKKKRNRPGNPDPSADVIALSPRSLMSKSPNRFKCEVCHKGFHRDQNLQFHMREHNLPWKLKVRSRSEVIRKKVYVCPESTCIHHNPTRALRDLTCMKKHFCRKHCDEKIWQCNKCPKKYAVESDCRTHSKICGVRKFKCKCGSYLCRTKEGFAAHIAMCDALALLKEKEKEAERRALMAKLVSVNHCSFSSLPINNNSALFQELIIKNNPPKLPNLNIMPPPAAASAGGGFGGGGDRIGGGGFMQWRSKQQ
ncbi:hypothetical protein Dsin_022401 [Dipteronia sinensis]|uniref:C2H2-type domain-containing protein n=1 Tax=Dipteronia sinensis TaxID=43782 RepID=A0AAE0DZW7_9ROSI|nr:hypothetical protein Dsin_022401 [Dipteronia sinensis]